MTDADFKWLSKKARNERTRKILNKIKNNWELIRSGRIIKDKSQIRLDLDNYKIFTKQSNASASVDTYTEIFKEKGHTNLSEFSGKKDNLVVDVGANEGFYTLKIKKNNPDVKIIAVEASPSTFNILKKNVLGNKLKNVKLIKKALTSKEGKVTFESVPEVSVIGSIDMGLQKRAWLKKSRIQKIIVNATTLKKIIENNKINYIDILKLDVEGAEMKILKSSKKLLNKIKRIVVEFHSEKLRKELKDFLRANNFKLLLEEVKPGQRCGDLYFVNKNK